MTMAHKGTVFKVKPQSLILMTGDFEFKEIKKRAPVKTGQEVLFDDHDIIRPHQHNRRWLALVASLLIFVLFSSALLQEVLVPDVYAYVGMDINPSLELVLDKKLEVIRAEARNEDAQKVLQGLSLRGLNLQAAVDTILESCSNQGYINNSTSHIMISTTINSTSVGENVKSANLEEQVLSYTRGQLEKKQEEVNVYVVKVNEEEREEALNKGVSAGKYYLWNKSRENGVELDLEKVNAQSMSSIVQNNDRVQDLLTKSATVKWKKAGHKQKGIKDTPKTPPGIEKKGDSASSSGRGVKGQVKSHGEAVRANPNANNNAKEGRDNGNTGNNVKSGEDMPTFKNNKNGWGTESPGRSKDPAEKSPKGSNKDKKTGNSSANNNNESKGNGKNQDKPQRGQTSSSGKTKGSPQDSHKGAPKNTNKKDSKKNGDKVIQGVQNNWFHLVLY